MLLDKGVRIPIRASIEHLDPGLYDRLERGDQLVAYTRGVVLGISGNPRHELVESIGTRALALEIVDIGPTRIVWEIIPASVLVDAAE